MIHLYRVYFADSHESAAKYVSRLRCEPVKDAVVRYMKSVSRMSSEIACATREMELVR